jgi:hypothetical protein
MTRSLPPRKTRKLSASIDRQLNLYALAATAAGVGILAGTQPAEAKVVYTPAHKIITGKAIPIDLNHDRNIDFFLFHEFFKYDTSANGLYACLNIRITSSGSSFCASSAGNMNAFRMARSGFFGAAVKRGAKIIGGDRFRAGQFAPLGGITAKYAWFGPWMNGGKGIKNRFLGIRFLIKGRFHYGWARITVKTQEKAFSAILTGYAYETVPGRGIVAGKTTGPDVVEWQPATLGHLARGASSIADWRSR